MHSFCIVVQFDILEYFFFGLLRRLKVDVLNKFSLYRSIERFH